jgi:hypothetical protein
MPCECNGAEETDISEILERDDIQVHRQQNADAEDHYPDKKLTH